MKPVVGFSEAKQSSQHLPFLKGGCLVIRIPAVLREALQRINQRLKRNGRKDLLVEPERSQWKGKRKLDKFGSISKNPQSH